LKQKPFTPQKPIYIAACASVAGKKEKEGPLGAQFDFCGDDRFGKDTWEKAEAEMQKLALSLALKKSTLGESELDLIFAGDLINQCISSSYGLSVFRVPFLGIFGACSTCAEGMLMAAMFSSHLDRCASVTSSHFCTAERQFRFPLDYGGQRPPTAQWTVTGSGAFLYTTDVGDLENCDKDYVVKIADVMPGCIVDQGISDANNMGAAMAPAAHDTLLRYFNACHKASDFNKIYTGDLGMEGGSILRELMLGSDRSIDKVHADCGCIVYDVEKSDTHAGGSGCGCSAVVMAADVIPKMEKGLLRDVLFVGTGALMNSMAINQKQTIPSIAHLVHLRSVPLREALAERKS